MGHVERGANMPGFSDPREDGFFHKDDEGLFQVPLGDGLLTMDPDEARVLLSLSHSGALGAINKVLEAIRASALFVLADPESNGDQLRVAQGRLSAVGEIARILGTEVQEWARATQAQKKEGSS